MYQWDRADNAHNLPEMCVSLFLVSHSHGVADGARVFYTIPQPTTLNVMCQCASISYLYPPQTARSTALQY